MGNINWTQKASRDSDVIAQVVQTCRDDLIRAQGIYSDPPYLL